MTRPMAPAAPGAVSLAEASLAGPDLMGREIAEGPDAVAATLLALDEPMPAARRLLADATRVVLLGTGASLAAARAVEPLWRRQLGGSRELVVRQSTEAALGGLDGFDFSAGDAVIAISQSGASPETRAAAGAARDAGAAVLAVTAHAEAPLAGAATLVLPLESGEELGASTKSELATAALLLALAGLLPTGDGAERVAAPLRSVVSRWDDARSDGERLAAADHVWFLGFGAGQGIAAAGLLLWHEKVLRPAGAATPSEFRHGQIEAASGAAVVLVDVDEADRRRAAYLERLSRELGSLKVPLLRISGTPDAPTALRSLEAVLAIQQRARATALAAGSYRDGFAVLRRVVTPATDLFA